MASSIQLFKSVRKYFRQLGIDPPQPSETTSINWRILSALFWFVQHFIAASAFLILEARTVIEFGTSFFGFIMVFYCVAYFLTLISQRHRIFKLIDNFELFIGQSKCFKIKCWIWNEFSPVLNITLGENSKIMYNECNENVERMCNRIYFVVVKMSFVGIILFPLVATVVSYFAGDLKEESYALPTPVTCVSSCELIQIFIYSFECFRFAFEDYHSTGVHHLAICWQ